TFGIAGRHDGRVDPEEAVLVEVAMDRHAEAVADARHSAERVRPGTEVRDFAQVFERGALRLNGVRLGVVNPADDLDALGLQLDRLPLPLARGEDAAGDDRASGGQLFDLAFVVGQGSGRHYLERVETGPV